MGERLRTENVTVRFGGVTAVDNVDLEIEPGSFTGLIGPNGAGKSTLVDAITGLVRSTGRVILGEDRIESLSAHRRARKGMARTFQSLELFADFTVRENLLVAAEAAGPRPVGLVTTAGSVSATDARSRVDSALDLLGLRDRQNAPVTDLSLGERKLVSVARAMSMAPGILLLDEPAAGLDSEESAELGARLAKVVEGGTTTLLIDHDMALVLNFCETVHVLEFGKLIESGTPSEIRSSERVTAAYLGPDARAGRQVVG